MFNVLTSDSSQATFVVFGLFHQCMIRAIGRNHADLTLHEINPFLSILDLLDLAPGDFSWAYITWMEGIIRSNHPIEARCHSATLIMQLLVRSAGPLAFFLSFTTYAPTLLRFLELCEDHYRSDPVFTLKPEHPIPSTQNSEIIALQLLRYSIGNKYDMADLAPMLISVLTRILRSDDRLQSRALGLELFAEMWRFWPFLSPSDTMTPQVWSRLVDAIGDPLEPQVEPPILTNEPQILDRYDRGNDEYNPVGVLLGLAISDAWRDHLRPSNFASCVGIMSREPDRRQILDSISCVAKMVTGSAEAQDKFAMLVKALDRLKTLGNYGAVQLMLLHIWSSPGMYSLEEETWRWLKMETHELSYTHGTECFDTFAMHIKEGF